MVKFEEYADPNHSWGDIPVVIICGDELQLPPVPAEAGLFAPIEGKSHEQKVGVRIFSGFHNVYRLTTAMRFNQQLHITLLEKMRTPGGCQLTRREWAAIENTNVVDPVKDLAGTEEWYQASYLWSVLAGFSSPWLFCTRPHQSNPSLPRTLLTRPHLPISLATAHNRGDDCPPKDQVSTANEGPRTNTTHSRIEQHRIRKPALGPGVGPEKT